ncbi:MAG: hypothetical protein LBQ25_12490 [Azonexus sp.]|nr:hypothetical protein [Azonexus sp.]
MRQLIADQAVLAGAQDVPPGVTIPMESREYRRFSDKYIDLLHLRWAAAYGFGDPEILSESAAKPFEEGIPSDLLWLFRRDNPSSFSGFAGGRAVIEKGAEGYTKLVIALIDRCLASDGADIRYSSILDIADPSLLEQYKINMPLTEIVIRRRKK